MFDRLHFSLERHRQHSHVAGLLRQSKTPAQNFTDALRLRSEIAVVLWQSAAAKQQAKTICCHSAKAICRVIDGRLAIDYTGSISLSSIIEIDRQTAVCRAMERSAIERMDTACTMFEASRMVRDMQGWPDNTPPSAVIVRPDQYSNSLAFCLLLERCGVRRSCWLDCQRQVADLWLAQF